MAITSDSRAAYTQLRSLVGWALLIAWVGFWWLHLDSIRHATLALPCIESGLDKAGDFFMGAGHACKARADNAFNAGLFWAVIVSPAAFVIGHFAAIMILAGGYAAAAASEKIEERQRQRAHAVQVAQIADRTRAADAATREQNDRYEFITRLGAVDDQLVVLAGELDVGRTKLIQLNLLQSLRDIHAKFSAEELRWLYRADEGVRSRVDLTLAEMRRLRLRDSRYYEDLAAMADVMQPAGR